MNETIIIHLKSIFARHGIPKIFYSDGGPQYTSDSFNKFCQSWEINNVRSSPENPRSDGLSERYIETYKKALQKSLRDDKDPYLTLLQLKNTPIDLDLPSPSQLSMSRLLRTNVPTTVKMLEPKIFNINEIIKTFEAK